MEPRIEYARSGDGTRIACWTLGSGAPLILMPNPPFSSIELEWRIGSCRAWYQSLAADYQLIGYDSRGSGLSQRDVTDFSLEAQVGDIEAVATRFRLERFPLIAVVHSTAPAVAFSARHPQSVEKLILWGPYARGSDYANSPRVQAVRALLRREWPLFAETVGFFAFGWNLQEQAKSMRSFVEQCTSQEATIRMIEAMDAFDVTTEVERVSCPALVLHRRKAAWPPLETATEIAASLRNARLAVIDGDSVAIWAEHRDDVDRAVKAFLLESNAAGRPRGTPESPLTEREREVLRLVAAGQSNKEIAFQLTVSLNTVERHLVNIYTKIGARGRADATAYALRNSLLP
jgi:pimeloyl-ACP methyl ester carboxylesterase/DNA-binding CsgD family transcriptional regulator